MRSMRTKNTFSNSEINKIKGFGADCIMILGAGIKDDETPTPMLKDRLDTGLMLYQAGAASKILLTGDNGSKEHNEIHVMLNYVKRQACRRKISSVTMRDSPPMIPCIVLKKYFRSVI